MISHQAEHKKNFEQKVDESYAVDEIEEEPVKKVIKFINANLDIEEYLEINKLKIETITLE